MLRCVCLYKKRAKHTLLFISAFCCQNVFEQNCHHWWAPGHCLPFLLGSLAGHMTRRQPAVHHIRPEPGFVEIAMIWIYQQNMTLIFQSTHMVIFSVLVPWAHTGQKTLYFYVCKPCPYSNYFLEDNLKGIICLYLKKIWIFVVIQKDLRDTHTITLVEIGVSKFFFSSLFLIFQSSLPQGRIFSKEIKCIEQIIIISANYFIKCEKHS